ncbi:PH domain-containing protein [Furfurilactobacillus siliginis]|uniref:Bacterial Pleckstrin homology domain-containing protein n=1 Tax=Furfurilactobacillus siliginis TaxID=348151 RepID=A0A0R2LEI2_9LACO|nr:PH domain-containing protein [Furfurilactobacillus siliginis]KRN96919.1 hypothetical protein IV55_GL000791 [Furfurilactobacillus siliginis]GEK28117.1 hypothetical protein LSI01_04280 [Furfurilactobacillus siliginis]
MALGFGHIVNGLLGNMSQTSTTELNSKYGIYLLPNEEIDSGFILVRDVIIFTNIRIIYINKKDVTGKKTNIQNIYLMNIIDVEVETAGFGIDDSDIKLTYLKNVQRRPYNEILETVKFEFPKSYEISTLYQSLEALAYQNRLDINNLKDQA